MKEPGSHVQVELHTLYVSSRRVASAWVVTLALYDVGCAHGPSAAETELGFRALQTHEAALTRAQSERSAQLQRVPPCGSELARTTTALCAAAEASCADAAPLSDRDADARCLRGRDSCRAAEQHQRARCATQAR